MRIWWLLALALAVSGQPIQEASSLRRWKTPSLELATFLDLKDSAGAGTNASSFVQQVPLEKTTHKSWISRLGKSFGRTLFGLILIPLALEVMWLSELRNARQDCILQLADAEVHNIPSESMYPELHGQLVLLNDSNAVGQDTMTDSRFPMVSVKGLRFRCTVQAYHWQQREMGSRGHSSDSITYHYVKQWSEYNVDSRHPGYRNHICVPGLKVGEESRDNRAVRYGDSKIYLPSKLVSQLSEWTDASDFVERPLKFDSCTFEKARDTKWFYHPMRNEPEVGDVRVCFEYVPDGPVSVMALQCEDDNMAHGAAASFLPYRLVNRGLCGTLSGDELKQALLRQGRMSFYEKDPNCRPGLFCYLCCCCNLINLFLARPMPEIFAAWHGHLSREQCFWEVRPMGPLSKWGIRILSWFLLYAAVYMLFEPLIVVLDIIPFVGKYISSGTSWVLGATILFITAMSAILVISLAYLVYYPLMAFICLAGVGLLLGAIMDVSRVL